MKKRFLTVVLFLALVLAGTGIARATSLLSDSQPALVFVSISSPAETASFAATGLPVFATVDGGLLTGTDQTGQQALHQAGLSYQVIDPDLRSGSYYLAQTWSSRPAPDYAEYGQVLLDLGSSVVLRMDPAGVDSLTQAGAELSAISLVPKALPVAQAEEVLPAVVEPDPIIQTMVDQVSTDQIYEYDRGLAGEIPVWVDGAWYTISTRYTYSGTPIQKATSFTGQHMAGLGLDVEYHVWGDNTYPNVIGQITGLVNPDDIYIIGGHIDDVSGAPGADDNASGSVAALVAADIMSQYQWGCTLRFAVWTGEEQGLNGSYAYAQRSYQIGENIQGYLNLDMIAWNTIGTDPTIYLGYGPSVPESLDLANLFEDVVTAYNFDLQPLIGSNYQNSSDHGSFLSFGYPAILGIEGDDDFNPYYHSPQDTPAHTDPAYFTEYVKAAIATYAHMSDCLIPSGVGALDGHVTDADDAAPIAGATVTTDDGQGHHQSTTTDADGYYTRTLLANTYAVTATAYGYAPLMVNDVVVTTDTVTTQDFALSALPTYVVSGHVYDSVSGDPLEGTLQFTDAPVLPVNTDQDGFYSIIVAQGTWHLKATSPSHMEQTQEVVVGGDTSLDFYLDPLPCILLVDDDNNSPDTTPYYTAALDAMGYEYNIFNTNGGSGPDITGLDGYKIVLWYSGDAYGGTAGPNGTDEANLAAYLDGGGKLFLDSQDYLYDFGLTPFGLDYLGVYSFVSDSGDATSIIGQPGDPIGDGLGPFSLTYPAGFTDYGDILATGAGASVPFKAVNNNNILDVDKDGGEWQTAFFATSWVPIYNNNAANGRAVLQRVVDFFGGCQVIPDEPIAGLSASNDSPTELGNPTTFTASVTGGTNVHYDWNFGDGETGSGSLVQHTYAASGSYVASVHAWNDVSEASASTTADVMSVTISPTSQEQLGEPGAQVSYTYTVTNDSPLQQDIQLSVESVWVVDAPASTGLLAPGGISPVTVVVTIPSQPDVIISEDTFTLVASGQVGGHASATGTTFANVTPAVEVIAPDGQNGEPLEVISYTFLVTNTGNYTDTFSLEVSGTWEATLPGGNSTGPLAAGSSAEVTVLVTVPVDALDGDTDVTTLAIASQLDPEVTASAQVTSRATLTPPIYSLMLPLITR